MAIGMAALACSSSACHLILDADEYRLHAPDAEPPADAPFDANLQLLALDDVEPKQIFEGQGSFADGPGIPIVLTGTNIAGNAVLTISGVDGVILEKITPPQDGAAIAAELRVPVDETRAEGAENQVLTLTITQGDPVVTASQTIEIVALDELVLGGVVTDASTLKTRYSRITTSADVTFTGAAPPKLNATSSIVVSHVLKADAAGTAAGAGGCAGGATGAAASCASGGGGAGLMPSVVGHGSGGGGGGASADGQNGGPGTQTAGGNGGGKSADLAAFMLPLAGGNGGGGGGAGNVAIGLGTAGGAGGGGGGAIELSSEGSLELAADLSATGAAGVTAGGGCGGLGGGGGGGGGGSGGSLFVRAFSQLTLGAKLVATKGAGGGISAAGCSNKGGDGADGFVRVDAPAATPAGLDATPAAARGAVFDHAVASIQRNPTFDLDLFGSANQTYGYSVGEGQLTAVTVGQSGKVTVSITIAPHVLVAVCAYVAQGLSGPQLSLPEAKTCRTFVYIP